MTDLAPEGRRLTKARTALRRATEQAQEAAIRDVAAGMSGSEAARRYGVTRMTIRTWLGKGNK